MSTREQDQTEEGLDWLHVISEQLEEQNEHLRAIRSHTRLFYGLAILWLILCVLAVAVWVVANHR